jgi:hypothetical protein
MTTLTTHQADQVATLVAELVEFRAGNQRTPEAADALRALAADLRDVLPKVLTAKPERTTR